MTVNEPNERQIIAPACVARAFTCVVGAIGYYSFFFHGRLHLLIKCSLSISCRFLFQCDWLINLQSVSCYPVTLTSPNDSCKKNFLSNQTRSLSSQPIRIPQFIRKFELIVGFVLFVEIEFYVHKTCLQRICRGLILSLVHFLLTFVSNSLIHLPYPKTKKRSNFNQGLN